MCVLKMREKENHLMPLCASDAVVSCSLFVCFCFLYLLFFFKESAVTCKILALMRQTGGCLNDVCSTFLKETVAISVCV